MEHTLPKQLVEVKGKAAISYVIEYLMDSVDKIVLCLGTRADEVIEFVKTRYPNVQFSIEDTPLGTAGAVNKALPMTTSEYILVLNGDDITDIDVSKLNQENTICVAHPRLPFGLVREKEGYAEFVEKPKLAEWTSCGWYVLSRDLPLPEKGSLEYDVFPKTELRVFKHEGFWRTINSKKDIDEFENCELPATLK
jgi:NDP-sugar pyrophosphorylase family protein